MIIKYKCVSCGKELEIDAEIYINKTITNNLSEHDTDITDQCDCCNYKNLIRIFVEVD